MSSLTRRITARDTESGFTLIELLVVILIIGVLASIAVPMFLNQRKAAVESSLRSDMKNLATQMYTYYAKHPLEKSLPPVGQLGWAIIVRSPGTIFIGDRNGSLKNDVYLDGMEPVKVSDGIALGLTTSTTAGQGRELGEFCILGNAEGTKYEAKVNIAPGTSQFQYALYYDSSNGGFFEPEGLSETGACGVYAKRIKDGV